MTRRPRRNHGSQFKARAALAAIRGEKTLAGLLSNTLTADFCVEALEEAMMRHGRPEIVNTDQGSQFTGTEFIGTLKAKGIAISTGWTNARRGILHRANLEAGRVMMIGISTAATRLGVTDAARAAVDIPQLAEIPLMEPPRDCLNDRGHFYLSVKTVLGGRLHMLQNPRRYSLITRSPQI